MGLAASNLAVACGVTRAEDEPTVEAPTPVPPTAVSETPTPVSPEGLRTYGEKLGIETGAWIAQTPFTASLSSSNPYDELVMREFNLIGGGLGWPIQPTNIPNSFVPGGMFAQNAAYATASHSRMRGHAFLWGNRSNLPDWLVAGSFSRTDMIKMIQDKIRLTINTYKGRVNEWVVVNEPLHIMNNIGVKDDFFAESIGPEYIEIAFEAARNTDNSAYLIYNDYGNETPGPVVDANAAQITNLKSKGLVNAIGLEMHIDGNHPPTKDALMANMKSFRDMGIDVLVTELDVNLVNLRGTQEARFAVQADIYRCRRGGR